MSKKATELQRKEMSKMYRGTEIFKPLNTGWIDENVACVRNELLPAGEREKNIPCDLNDTSWFSEIDAADGAVFYAAGVFYYFLKEQVKALVQKMAGAFPGSVLVFDAANEKAVKLMLKT